MTFDELKEKVLKFRDERDWKQFHTPDNLAKSINIEAGELLECFQWNNENFDINDVSDELADVFVYCINMADILGLDLIDIASKKMDKNALKYPIDKAKGNAKKYDKF